MQSSSAGDSKPSGDNEARLTAKLKRVLSAPTQVVKLPRTHRPGEQVEPAKAAKQEESSHRIPYANPDAKAVRWVTNSSVAEFEERREESASPLSPMERAVYHPTSDSFLSPDRDELQVSSLSGSDQGPETCATG